MFERLKPHFDAESLKVYFASVTGSAAAWNWNAIISGAVGAVTFVYIILKIIKQVRDWRRPDKD